jgi:hypothetical protein
MSALTDGTEQLLGEFDAKHEPEQAIRILAFRVVALTKEKEGLEQKLKDETQSRVLAESDLGARLATMEKSYQRGIGIFWALTAMGSVIGFILATSKSVVSIWQGKP